jgi:hypothetical protein
MIVGIHQPNFLPWVGYFYKMSRCDTFVVLDDVQFSKGSFQNRNRIKTANGVSWLTVPVLTRGRGTQCTDEVLINVVTDWRRKHWNTICQNYGRTPYFSLFADAFSEIYSCEWTKLVDLNEALIRQIFDYLDIYPTIVKSSNLETVGHGAERLISICKTLGVDTYLSGFGGQSYQDQQLFDAAGIKLEVYGFRHPVYPQLWGDFIENLSVIDLLFNCGERSREIIRSCST